MRPAATAEQLTEQVFTAVAAENISKIHVSKNIFLGIALVESGVTILIVLTTFFRIGKNGIGFGHLFELFFSALISRIFVGVVFLG